MKNSPSPPGPGSRTGLYAAVGFLLVVGICLVLVLVNNSGGPSGSGSQPATSAPAAGGGDPALDQTIPTAAPSGVSWEFFRGVALPSSALYGPKRVNGDVAAGYAHSPIGALLAATNISARYGFGADWADVVDQQTMPGPGREAWTAIRAQHPISASDTPTPGAYGQYTGFRFVNYTPDVATIQVVTQFANAGGIQQITTLTVQWSNDDWRLVLQPNGGASPTASPATSLEQFVPWGPS